MNQLSSIWAALALIIALFVGTRVEQDQIIAPSVNSYEECVAFGNLVMESYPERCAHEGVTYVRELTEEEKQRLEPSVISPTELIEEVPPVEPVMVEPTQTVKECIVGGCSSQLCVSTEEADGGGGISTCEWTEAYACYATASCEIQSSGECGWTVTEELNQCLQGAK